MNMLARTRWKCAPCTLTLRTARDSHMLRLHSTSLHICLCTLMPKKTCMHLPALTCSHSKIPPNPLCTPQAVYPHSHKLTLTTVFHPSSQDSPILVQSHFFTLNVPGPLNAGHSTTLTHKHTPHTHTYIYTHTHMHTNKNYPTVPGPPASTAEGCTARRAR